MTDPGRWRAMVYVAVSLWSLSARSAENGSGVEEKLGGLAETIDFVQQRITKTVADGVWFQRFQGVANVEKVLLVAPAPENPIQRKITTNGVIVSAYTLMPARRLGPKL